MSGGWVAGSALAVSALRVGGGFAGLSGAWVEEEGVDGGFVVAGVRGRPVEGDSGRSGVGGSGTVGSLAPAFVTVALGAGWAGVWFANRALASGSGRGEGSSGRWAPPGPGAGAWRWVAVDAALTYAAMLAWVVGLLGATLPRAVAAELGFAALFGVVGPWAAQAARGGGGGGPRAGRERRRGRDRVRAAAVAVLGLALAGVGLRGVGEDVRGWGAFSARGRGMQVEGGVGAGVTEAGTSMPLFALSSLCAWVRLEVIDVNARVGDVGRPRPVRRARGTSPPTAR